MDTVLKLFKIESVYTNRKLCHARSRWLHNNVDILHRFRRVLTDQMRIALYDLNIEFSRR